MPYKVKEVRDMVGVSVRTLHYYDQIGLLKPESVSAAGYRLYTDSDLERLQQILFFKELDFNLQEIKEILDSRDFDRVHALKAHRDMLIKKKKRLERIIKSVEKTIDSAEGGEKMNKKEMFDGFSMEEIEKHKEKYAKEVKEKYGDSHAFKESQSRTSKYSKEDWAIIMKKQGEIYKKLSGLMDREPADSEVQKSVEDWREHINRYFYTCTPEIFRGLGELYVNDERFTANIDKVKSGLAKFLSEAIKVYCDNLK